MEYVTEGFEPRDALHYFEELSAIPRGSGNEKAVSDFVAAFAGQQGLETVQDEVNNVYVRIPASDGYEDTPAVMLQGHLDMVCEKRESVVHDFEKDPLKLRVKDGRLMAGGTTLGADDGVAIAYMMALMSRHGYPHPPLELLLTVDEETGMTGASSMQSGFFKARRLINLDGGPEGTVLVSCSGGLRAKVTKACRLVPPTGRLLSIRLHGLKGGHSGEDIDKERGNANKLLGRILYAMLQCRPFSLIELNGGSKENAIPLESGCVAACAPGDFEALASQALQEAIAAKAELALSDPGLDFEITEGAAGASGMFSAEDTADIVRLLYLLPNGIRAQSTEIAGLVTCSNNVGILRTRASEVAVYNALRSPVASMKDDLARQIAALAGLCGAVCERGNDYPGWPYQKDSALRETCMETYRSLYGRDMEPLAIHAGVECGIFSEKLPGIDMVSIGPEMHDFHTPEEWLDLASFKRTFEYLLELLRRLA
ncbi:MAG: aminoacyl-histidine dipeptidase [Clostridia bacterium]|nr:aminoacyl-histidine dipeptidase [Clostridia bacterium]